MTAARLVYLAVAFAVAGALLVLFIGGLALFGLTLVAYLADVARRAF